MFVLFFLMYMLSACSPHSIPDHVPAVDVGVGGGQDAVTFDLPFASGYTAQCVQGVGGKYSHNYNSTYYDVDFDTPNDSDDPLYAPYSGTAYVHTNSPGYGFGIHVNIDMGDGTYLVLGHLDKVLVADGEEVSAGQLIGVEGTTGYSTGDHVHMGRHEGDAQKNGVMGKSIAGMALNVYDSTTGVDAVALSSELSCDLSSGHVYQSKLSTPRWHPNGTLVKTYNDSEVYIIENGQLRHFASESVFWSYNFSFENVAVIDESELDCYGTGSAIAGNSKVQAVQSGGEFWLLIGQSGDSESYSVRIGSTDSEKVLQSWGVMVGNVSDLPEDSGDLENYVCHDGYAQFRDGSLVTEESSSDVYVISDGVAMPVADWDTYLLMDFYNRAIITVGDGTVAAVQERVGTCASDLLCVTSEDLFVCGGPSDVGDWGGGEADAEDEKEDEQEEQDDEEEVEDDSIPDDLGEELSWIHVDRDSLGLTVSDLFSSSVDGQDVAVTGYGFPIDWSYSTDYLVYYDSATDIAWYELSDGKYRMNMRTLGDWADIQSKCEVSGTASALCHQNNDEYRTYSLCFEVRSGELWELSERECDDLS